jgi:hypothetical protein
MSFTQIAVISFMQISFYMDAFSPNHSFTLISPIWMDIKSLNLSKSLQPILENLAYEAKSLNLSKSPAYP